MREQDQGAFPRRQPPFGLAIDEDLRDTLETKQPMPIHLRPTTPNDFDFVLAAEASPAAAPFILAWSRERHEAALTNPDLRHAVVIQSASKEAVGFLILAGLTNPHRAIEFMRLVITQPGGGYGRTALEHVAAMAFGDLGAHRLWLDVFEDNARARQLYRNAGYTEEGVLREAILGPSGYRNLVLMSQLQHEYRLP